MAAAAAVRREAREAAGRERLEAERARLDAGFPALPGEGDVMGDPPYFLGREHRGHRSHRHPWHGNGIICSCGAVLGCFSIALTGDEPEPEPCPVCIARGIPLDRR